MSKRIWRSFICLMRVIQQGFSDIHNVRGQGAHQRRAILYCSIIGSVLAVDFAQSFSAKTCFVGTDY